MRRLLPGLLIIVCLLAAPALAQKGIGFIAGVAAVERSNAVQANGTRSVCIYLFYYNDTARPMAISIDNWRLSDDAGTPCVRWRPGGPKEFTLRSGQMATVSPTFTYTGSSDINLTLHYHSRRTNFDLPVVARTTNLGDFGRLPPPIQDTVTTGLRNDPNIHWWGQ